MRQTLANFLPKHWPNTSPEHPLGQGASSATSGGRPKQQYRRAGRAGRVLARLSSATIWAGDSIWGQVGRNQHVGDARPPKQTVFRWFFLLFLAAESAASRSQASKSQASERQASECRAASPKLLNVKLWAARLLLCLGARMARLIQLAASCFRAAFGELDSLVLLVLLSHWLAAAEEQNGERDWRAEDEQTAEAQIGARPPRPLGP